MNKKILCVSAAALMALTATNALADCNGVYLGGRAGIYSPKVKQTKGGNGTYKFGKSAWEFSGAIGYRYNYLRAELEGVLRESKEKTLTSGTKQKFEADSYMLNVFWDLSPYTMFTPYLMAGVGFSKVELNSKSSLMSLSFKENTNFTWSAGAGISAKVTSRFNVDLGYRYFDMDKVSYARITSHEGYIGLRYVF